MKIFVARTSSLEETPIEVLFVAKTATAAKHNWQNYLISKDYKHWSSGYVYPAREDDIIRLLGTMIADHVLTEPVPFND